MPSRNKSAIFLPSFEVGGIRPLFKKYCNSAKAFCFANVFTYFQKILHYICGKPSFTIYRRFDLFLETCIYLFPQCGSIMLSEMLSPFSLLPATTFSFFLLWLIYLFLGTLIALGITRIFLVLKVRYSWSTSLVMNQFIELD